MLLHEVEARQGEDFGQWEIQPDGERKWVSLEPTQEDLVARENWVPNPEDLNSMDSLFHTCLGNLDIVPNLTGDYNELMQRAKPMEIHGQAVWVAHIDELQANLTIPRRKKT
jgi:hypothetical protein